MAPVADQAFEQLGAIFKRAPGVTFVPGWAARNHLLKVGGKIFAMVDHGRLVLKLPRARVDELVSKGLGTRFDPRKNGRLMKEWFVAGGAGADWSALAREAHRFVKEGKR